PLRLRRLWRRRLGRVGHGGRRHQALVGPKQLAVQTGRQLPVRLRLVQLVPPFGQLRRQTVAGGLLLADGGQDGLGVVVTPAGQLLGQLGQLCRLHCALGQPLFQVLRGGRTGLLVLKLLREQKWIFNLFEEIHRPTSCLSCWALADRSSSTTGARAASLASRSTIEGFLSIRVSFSLQLLCRLWLVGNNLSQLLQLRRLRRHLRLEGSVPHSSPIDVAAGLPMGAVLHRWPLLCQPLGQFVCRDVKVGQLSGVARSSRRRRSVAARALMPEPHLRWPAETPPSDGPPGRAPCVATVPTPSGLSSLLRRPRRLPALSAGRRGVAARRRVPPRLCPRRAGIAEPSLRFDARGAGAAPRQLGRRALLAGAAAAPTAVDREGRQQLPAERQATALRLRCWPTAGPAAALHRLQWPVRPLMLGDAVVDVAERTLLFRTCGVSFKRRMKDSLVWYCPVVRLRGPASDASSSLFNALAASASSSSFSRRSHSSRSRPPAISDTSSAKSASFSSRASMNADSLGCTSLTARPSYQGPPLVQILQQRLGLIRRFVRPLCRRPSLGRQLRRPGHRRRLLGRGRGVSQQLLGQAVQLVQSALVGRHLLEVLLAALPDSGGAIGQHQVGRLVSGQGGLLPGQPVVEGFGQFEEAKLPDSLGERALSRAVASACRSAKVASSFSMRCRMAVRSDSGRQRPRRWPRRRQRLRRRRLRRCRSPAERRKVGRRTPTAPFSSSEAPSCIFISVTSSSYGSSTAINGSSSPSATAESSADCSSPSLKSSSSSSSPRLLCTSSVVSWNSGVLSRQFARRLCAAKGLQLLAQILVTLEQRGCRAGVVPDVPTGQQRRHAGHVIVGLAGRGKELLSVQALSCIGLAGVQQSAKVAPAGAQAAQPVADSLLALLRRLDGDFIAVVNVAAVVGSVLQLSGLAGVFIFAAANQLKEISRCLQATPPVGERLQQALVVLLQRHQLLAQRHRRSAGRAAVAETPGSACDAVHLNGEATSSKINKSAKTFLKLTCSCKAINSCSEILCLARKFSHDIRSVPVSHELTPSRVGSQGGLLLSEGLGQASPPGADVVSVARHDGLVVIILFNKALCGLVERLEADGLLVVDGALHPEQPLPGVLGLLQRAREAALVAELLRQLELEKRARHFTSVMLPARLKTLAELGSAVASLRVGDDSLKEAEDAWERLLRVQSAIHNQEAIRFEPFYKAAQRLIEENYHDKAVVARHRDDVSARWAGLTEAFAEKEAALRPYAEMASAAKEVEVLRAQLQALRESVTSCDTGTDLMSCENFLARHRISEQELIALHEQVNRIAGRARRLCDGRTTGAPAMSLSQKLMALEEDYQGLLQAFADRRRRLETARDFLQLIRSCEDEDSWLAEKLAGLGRLQQQSADGHGDLRAARRFVSRLQTEEAEIEHRQAAWKCEICHLCSTCESAQLQDGADNCSDIDDGDKVAVQTAKQRQQAVSDWLSRLRSGWRDLRRLLHACQADAAQRLDAQQFFASAGEADDHMAGVAPLLAGRDVGHDAGSAAALLKRHQYLRKELQAFGSAETTGELAGLRETAKRLTSDGDAAAPRRPKRTMARKQLTMCTAASATRRRTMTSMKARSSLPRTQRWRDGDEDPLIAVEEPYEELVTEMKMQEAEEAETHSTGGGDIFELLQKTNKDWYSVRDLTTNKRGFLPAIYLTEISPTTVTVRVAAALCEVTVGCPALALCLNAPPNWRTVPSEFAASNFSSLGRRSAPSEPATPQPLAPSWPASRPLPAGVGADGHPAPHGEAGRHLRRPAGAGDRARERSLAQAVRQFRFFELAEAFNDWLAGKEAALAADEPPYLVLANGSAP
uniref:IRS-type PTB domain-containing protein n=1 Tax=Macrostomum lignano TaxID=282301 RepID=A0A1I8IEV5_9PLAT